MRKVANKKTIRAVGLRMVKTNRKKNIPVIIAVILTTMLFTTLFSVGISMVKTTQRTTMRQVGGSSMAGLKYGRSVDYEKLKKDFKIKNISYRIIVGTLADDCFADLVNEVYYSEEDNAKCCFSYPTIGSMPQEQNDIVLSSLALDKLGLREELGQTIHLKIQVGEKIVDNDFVLCGIYEGDVVATSQMAYVSKKYQELVAPEPQKSYYTSQLNDMTGYRSIDFDFYHSFNIEKQTKDLLIRNGYDLNEVQYGINWAYAASSVDVLMVVLYLTILIIILAAGYLIIYNIFYIRVTTDIHEYGLLKTIGTTGRQLKRMVGIQADILAFIGIIVGLLSGTLVSWRVFPLVLANTTFQQNDMVFSIHPMIYIFASGFAYLTVRLGCRKPQKIVSRVSPIEAVTYIDTDKIKRKKKKTGKITVLKLAVENLKREKRKTFIVLLSFTLSILLVNVLYSVIIGLDSDKYISQCIIGDYNVSHVAWNNVTMFLDDTTVVEKKDIDYISNLDGVKECSNIYCDMFAEVMLTEPVENWIRELYDNCSSIYKEEIDVYLQEQYMPCNYYGIDKFPVDYIDFKEGKFDEKLWETGEYVIFYASQIINESMDEYGACYQVGDEVTINLANKKKTYKIMAIGSMPYAMSTKCYSGIGCELIVPEDEYLKNKENSGALVSIIEAQADGNPVLEENIKSYVESTEYLSYDSKQKYLGEFDSFIRSIVLIGGGLAVILAVIGIMNFANSVITGVWRRARELSMMQAVGLTDRQMMAMLALEGVVQGVATIVFSIMIWIVIGKFVIKGFAGDIWFFNYSFSIKPILICLPFVLIIAIVIPLMACHNMNKKSIIERMRIE